MTTFYVSVCRKDPRTANLSSVLRKTEIITTTTGSMKFKLSDVHLILCNANFLDSITRLDKQQVSINTPPFSADFTIKIITSTYPDHFQNVTVLGVVG